MNTQIEPVTYRSKLDGTMQPAVAVRIGNKTPASLLVALHTWSYDYTQDCKNFSDFCIANGWNMIFPNFRGANNHSEGCGSDFVVSDIEDAVAFMKQTANVDPRRIYLCGGSGGGHCALLMAGRRPELWTAVSAWCPITDLTKWHAECRGKYGYAEHIEQACGGNPEISGAAAVEARLRSPLSWLPNAAGLTVDISTGIHDGHPGRGTVPVSHSIQAYNALCAPEDIICGDDLRIIVESEQIPEHLRFHGKIPAFGENSVLLRRQSCNVRLTIFEGAHDLLPQPALGFLARQTAMQTPDWSPEPVLETNRTRSVKLGK